MLCEVVVLKTDFIMKLKDFLEGQKAMYLFKKGYTYHPRWFEISLGIIGWFGLVIIFYGVLNLLCVNLT